MPLGYRVETTSGTGIAWEALQFEYEELGNDHILDDIANFISKKGSWDEVFPAFKQQYSDTTGLWLTREKKDAIRLYGDYGDIVYVYRYTPQLIVSDLGEDGIFVLNPVFIREEEK